MAKIKYVLNPLSGEFDAVQDAEALVNSIVTHELGPAGQAIQVYDSYSGTHITMGPFVVVDNNGNLVCAI